MANIVITERCNLACPYCFADEFVNKKTTEISVENFDRALEFIMTSESYGNFVGIIGGEPTLHGKFPELLHIVKRIDRLREVLIFTNGIKIDETFDLIQDDKFSLLINLNSPIDIGEKNYARIIKNIDDLVRKYDKKRSITLGLNIYRTDIDYSFFIDLVAKYRFRSARLSVTIPNADDKLVGIDRLLAFKHTAYQLYVDLQYHGTKVVFDCNKIPKCVWSDSELKKILLFQANNENERLGFALNKSKCNPVIDILPDLTAIRCFGFSETSKVKISDFSSLDDLYEFYIREIDDKFIKIPSALACNSCELFAEELCSGGCLATKSSQN